MYEVEVKALVRDIPDLRQRIEFLYPEYKAIESKQLNHYFDCSDKAFSNLLLDIDRSHVWESVNLPTDIYQAKNIAVRTRWDSKKGTLFIIKYSVEDTNSQNGNVRREFECVVPTELNSLDEWILNNGLTYQSKWSRDRIEYKYDSWSICTDINAGYRGLCEVEKVIPDLTYKNDALLFCRLKLRALGLVDLESSLLDRMFRFYSANYNDFYGTDKSIFDDVRFANFE
jgi:adenylate cyclase class IV